MIEEPFSHSSGPHHASVALVGESWGAEEAAIGLPFVGASGKELTRMLTEAGLDRSRMFLTNVVNTQPLSNELHHLFHPMKEATETAVRGLHPKEAIRLGLSRLQEELSIVRPKLIIAAGNYALWALSTLAGTTPGKDRRGRATSVRVPNGIMKWRGSMVHDLTETRLLPIVHPAAILRQWTLRDVTVHDLRTRVPQALNNDWSPTTPPLILAPPTFTQAMGRMNLILRKAQAAPVRVSVDVETKRTPTLAFITCVSLCDEPHFSMSIPLVLAKTYAPYWSLDEETALMGKLREVLGHPNTLIEGQNFIYDLQYFAEYPAVHLSPAWDTMTAQHLLFPGTPKGLDYLSSLYCRHHRYWKDDNKEWDQKGDLITHLRYNAEDALRTYEIATTQRKIIPDLGLADQMLYMQQTTDLALNMMRRGVRTDQIERKRLHSQIMNDTIHIHMWFEEWLPQSVVNPHRDGLKPWYRSSIQIRQVFLDWGLHLPMNRKTGAATTNATAMVELREKYPGLREVFDRLLALRSLGIFAKNFLGAKLEPDGRMHCQFNPAGTGTFRWSSSTNAFNRGTNMQNIPKRVRDFGDEYATEEDK